MRRKIIIFILVAFVFLQLGFAQSVKEISDDEEYVASTSWVAAIAQLSGIDDVVSIAPANLRHPPEYEITPQDMVKVANAKLFMHAGYERMMKTIADASEIDSEKIIKVRTTNTLENLRAMVDMLSEKAGTEDKAHIRFAEFEKMILDARKRISSSQNRDLKVYVNVNQAEFAKDLGLNIFSTFGPEPMTSDEIAIAAENKFVLVIDNIHSPVASPVTEVSPDSFVLMFRNFPEHYEENALYNVVKENLNLLWSTGLF